MNWFTQEFLSSKSNERKNECMERYDNCGHIKKPNDIHMVSFENDSFGREGTCLCLQCYKDMLEAEAEELVVCDDCKGTFKAKDTREWRWYDFYANQGDEPLIICNTCRKAETHQKRIAKDKADMEAEFEHYDDEDDEEYFEFEEIPYDEEYDDDEELDDED